MLQITGTADKVLIPSIPVDAMGLVIGYRGLERWEGLRGGLANRGNI